jgi:CRISPR-associated protein Csb3
MNDVQRSIRVSVDPTNPGQFFACCGLLELADRLWPGTEGRFEQRAFTISTSGDLAQLIRSVSHAGLTQLDPDNDTSSPVEIANPFQPLRLDWWQDERSGGRQLKVWAGSMESTAIARAMQHALRSDQFVSPGLLDIGVIVRDADDSEKKREPFYFDARRGPNAHSRDIGFAPNDLQMTTTAFPAVEFLCLVGLQRCLPARTEEPGVFDYYTWAEPLPPMLLPAAVSGLLPHIGRHGYRFENWYRTGQKKHKAFRSATPLTRGD